MDNQAQECQIHQQEGLAIDLSQNSGEQSQYLCSACLSEKYFSKNQIVWKDEAKEMLKDMKTKEFKCQKSQIEQKIEEYQSIQLKIQNYQEQINNSITKLLNLINQRIEEQKSQLDKLSIPEQVNLNSQNIKQLSQFINGDQKLDTTQLCNVEQENEFKCLILEQLERLQYGEGLKDIIHTITELSSQKSKIGENIENDSEDEQKKIYSLPFNCKTHGMLITMVTLDQQQKDDRLLCPQCLQDSQFQLTSLMQLNQLWIDYQGKNYKSLLNFNTEREEKLQSIIKIFLNLQEKQQSIQNEITKQLIQQSNLVKKELMQLESNQIQKNIQRLELNEIRKIVNVLGQKDQMDQLKLKQSNIETQDEIFFNEITQKLQSIEQYQIQSEIQYFNIINKGQTDDRVMNRMNIKQLGDYFKDKTFNQQIFQQACKQLENKFQSLYDVWKQLINQAKGQSTQNPIKQEQNSFECYEKIIEQQEQRLQLLTKNVDKQNCTSQTDSNLTTNQNIINIQVLSYKQVKLEIKNQVVSIEEKQQKNNKLSINSKFYNYKQKFNRVQVTFSIKNQIIVLNQSNNKKKEIKINTAIIIQKVQLQRINQINGLKFSTQYKHDCVILSNDFKMATIKTGRCLSLCDQPIPQSGIHSVDFKILSDTQFVGVCVKDIIPKDFKLSVYSQSGQGQYLMAHDNNVFIDYNFENSRNCKKAENFSRFQINDIITVTVNQNQKQISWQNKQKKESFILDFKETQDLYFCVYSYDSESKTELV